jgi:hypothetical protein
MKGFALRRIAAIVLASTALFILGCSDDSEQPTLGEHLPTYKSLTEKENLIYNLVLCYKQHNITRYEELLDQQFYFHNQDETFADRAADIAQTGKMFAAAENTYSDPKLWLDKLELWIAQPGTWTQMAEINGAPCTDCWETTREYSITAIIAGGATTYIGNAQARFIAIGVDPRGKRIYQLRHIYDTPSPN